MSNADCDSEYMELLYKCLRLFLNDGRGFFSILTASAEIFIADCEGEIHLTDDE